MSSQPLYQLESNTAVGPYFLQTPIGKGAFAEVWQAIRADQPDRVVALKVAVDRDFRRQLLREKVHSIDHPNILPILDSDTSLADTPYLALPFMAKGSLADLLSRHPQGLPETLVETLLKDILEGLQAAHAQGVIHRDVKPSNILLTDEGGAVVADFGLSFRFADRNALTSLMASVSQSIEQHRSLAGTLAYMPKEIWEGHDPTPAMDVYAAGVLLFEMLTGRRPDPLDLPRHYRPNLRNASTWDALYYWACCSLDKRYPDAGAMRNALLQGPKPPPSQEPAAPEAPAPLPEVKAEDLHLNPATLDEGAENLAAYWKTIQEIDRRQRECRKQIAEAMKIYTDRHFEVKKLRQEESRLQRHKQELGRECGDVTQTLLPHVRQELASLHKRRDGLLQEGCRPEHPDVRALDERIHPKEELLVALETFPGDSKESRRLIAYLEAWVRAENENTSQAYQRFLKFHPLLNVYDDDPFNLWRDLARRRAELLRAEEESRRQAQERERRMEEQRRRARSKSRIVMGLLGGPILGETLGLACLDFFPDFALAGAWFLAPWAWMVAAGAFGGGAGAKTGRPFAGIGFWMALAGAASLTLTLILAPFIQPRDSSTWGWMHYVLSGFQEPTKDITRLVAPFVIPGIPLGLLGGLFARRMEDREASSVWLNCATPMLIGGGIGLGIGLIFTCFFIWWFPRLEPESVMVVFIVVGGLLGLGSDEGGGLIAGGLLGLLIGWIYKLLTLHVYQVYAPMFGDAGAEFLCLTIPPALIGTWIGLGTRIAKS